MISFIKGELVDIDQDKVVVECNNMGFNIFVTSQFISKIGSTGKEVKLYTHMSVREDGITLFGFERKEELKAFKLLITVSGIGPKGALAVLSVMTVEELKLAIMANDAKAMSKTPGIGAKTASKVILDLKDKFDVDEVFVNMNLTGDVTADSDEFSADNDAVLALIALGYSKSEAVNGVRKALKNSENADADELIRLALKFI